MKILKEIFGRVYAFWAAFIFMITLLPVALIMWILGLVKEPERIRLFIKMAKVWISIYFFLIGCRLKLKGLNNFAKDENYIIICNHTSFMDVLVTTPFIPGPSKTIAKSELAKIPIFGLVYKRGSVLVNRRDKNSRVNSIAEMKEVLKMKMHMCIYPEGTRNKTKLPLKDFHSGAFKLAIETGKSILPALLFNTKKVMPSDKTFFAWPAKMEVHYLPPVKVAADDDVEILKNNLHQLMSEYYTLHVKDL